MSNEVGHRIVDLFRSQISTQFEVQTVISDTHRVGLVRRGGGFEILEAPLNGAPVSADSLGTASVARFKGKDVADALRKCSAGATSLVCALLPDHIVPNEGLPLTVLAEAQLTGKRSARLFLAAGFEFAEGRLLVEPVYLAVQEMGRAIQTVPVCSKPLLAALEADSDLFDAAFEDKPGAISLLIPYVSGASELAEAIELEAATPTAVDPPSQNTRLRSL